MTQHSILWRRLDQPGHEACRLEAIGDGWRLDGSAVFLDEKNRPCRLDYVVSCDARWHTRHARVTGWIAGDMVDLELLVDGAGVWGQDGVACSAVSGCIDLDMSFTPATNLLPIRRMGLGIGASALTRAAWLTFPELRLEPLDQIYRRTRDNTYAYEAPTLGFAAELTVNEAGLVTHYPGLWTAEAVL